MFEPFVHGGPLPAECPAYIHGTVHSLHLFDYLVVASMYFGSLVSMSGRLAARYHQNLS